MSDLNQLSNEKLFERVLDAIPDLVLIKSENSKIVWGNKAFRSMYGMTNEQLHDLIDAPVVEPDHTLQYVMDDLYVWKNKKPLVIDCEAVTRFDGIVRKYRTFKFPIFDDAGQISNTAGVSTDITENIESEQKLEASAKMAALGEMAGGIAHEINNPLAVIGGKARQLRRAFEQDKAPSKEKIIENLQAIEQFTNRIAEIVVGLQRFSRDGTNDPLELCSLKKIIDETLVLCKVGVESKGVAVELSLQKDAIIKCRPVQISQVILNVINNAVDAVEHAQLKKIWIATEINAKTIHLRIWDTGNGVSDEIVNRIMQPFFTTKEVGKGTGLGLSISQGIVKDHGGDLRLDRVVSKSCFKISLPICTDLDEQESNI